jgi:hypothetical protein
MMSRGEGGVKKFFLSLRQTALLSAEGKKRRDGKGAAHKVRGRERAAAKAAEKTAEEAKGTAGVAHNFDSDDMEN